MLDKIKMRKGGESITWRACSSCSRNINLTVALKCALALKVLKAVEFDITDGISNGDVTSHLHLVEGGMFEEGDKGKLRRASGGSNGDGEMGHGSRCKLAHMRFES